MSPRWILVALLIGFSLVGILGCSYNACNDPNIEWPTDWCGIDE